MRYNSTLVKLLQYTIIYFKGMLLCGEASILAFSNIGLHSLNGDIVDISILLNKFRTEAVGNAQKVIANQYLTITAIASADTDGSHSLQLSSNLGS